MGSFQDRTITSPSRPVGFWQIPSGLHWEKNIYTRGGVEADLAREWAR